MGPNDPGLPGLPSVETVDADDPTERLTEMRYAGRQTLVAGSAEEGLAGHHSGRGIGVVGRWPSGVGNLHRMVQRVAGDQ